jgi:hypothetical protein
LGSAFRQLLVVIGFGPAAAQRLVKRHIGLKAHQLGLDQGVIGLEQKLLGLQHRENIDGAGAILDIGNAEGFRRRLVFLDGGAACRPTEP